MAVNLHRALEIGRAQAAHGAAAPLPLLVELLRLDDAIADAVLLQDLTWIDGEPHLFVGNVRIRLSRGRAGRITSTLAAAARVSAMG